MVGRLAALMLALAAPVVVAQAQPGPPAPPAGAVAGSFRFPDRPIWAGEVFDLKLVWQVDWDLFRYIEADLSWTADPLITEGWTRDPQGQPRSAGGRSVADLPFSTRAMGLQPGSIRLKPARQQMQIVNGSYETSGVRIATIGAVSASSAGATVTVRPLPPAPPGFTGAVGDFTLGSTLDKKEGEVGKPIVWTVTLSGTGNWSGFDGVPSRQLQRAFDVVGMPRQTGEDGGSLFERTIAEEITIVPRTAGAFSLGPVEMTVFDPGDGRYRTITAPAIAIDVKPGASAGQPPAYEAEPDVPGSGGALPPILSGAAHVRAPLPLWAWRGVLALPLAVLGLLWLGLAANRAFRTDPDRASRRAHAGLIRTIAELATASGEACRRRLVRAWQRDTGARFNIGHAAPLAGMFDSADWARLWDEADRYLYAYDTPLPADWQARAETMLAGLERPPGFDGRSIFTARNLFPVAALLCAFLAISPASLSAMNGLTSSPQHAVAPRDWVGHYNLGRKAAEAKQWNSAAAQAGIAWVQQPRLLETTRLWSLSAREAGFGGRAAGGLPLPDDAIARWASLLSPLGWQAVTMAGVLFAISGFGGLLLRRFGHVPRSAVSPVLIAAGLGALGIVAGVAGVHGYGPAAASDAAIVWRQVPLRDLPVETPDDEVAVILAPGTVGHMDRAYPGWIRFTRANGHSGWLRRDELLPLWQDRP